MKKINGKKIWNLGQREKEEKINTKKTPTSPFALRNSEPTADWPGGSKAESPFAGHVGSGSGRRLGRWRLLEL